MQIRQFCIYGIEWIKRIAAAITKLFRRNSDETQICILSDHHEWRKIQGLAVFLELYPIAIDSRYRV